MSWLAFDLTIKDAETFQLEGPLARWRSVRDEIHRTVCEQGYSRTKRAFTQSFGDEELDASLLLIPQLGFLPISDPRVVSTIAAIERELLVGGFVRRYRTESGADGLPPGEGIFIPCSFWLAQAYELMGRHIEADALIDRLLALRNDVGLLSEEYDASAKRQVGNFPQAYSHLALVQSLLAGESRLAVPAPADKQRSSLLQR
jgi:GH15 family glucan-1,4-alpha-glucosidase